MSYNNILVETADNIAVLTINRPDQLNALNSETIGELSSAFKTLEADNNVKAIIISGSGTKAFVAGADIKEFYQFDVAQGKELAANGHKTLFDLVQNLTTNGIFTLSQESGSSSIVEYKIFVKG